MKQVLIQKGNVIIPEVPAPMVAPRSILVQVHSSCISIGTELAGVKMSALPLYRRALKQPHHVKKVIEVMRDQGVERTIKRIMGMLGSGTPTGYSAAGKVIQIGEQVTNFRIADLVGCAGAGVANHAEYIDVPVNLAVRVPEKIDLESASTVTLGSIALQGVRRLNPTLGETIVVLGLGVLGQLTVQMLKANGCRVIGIDQHTDRVSTAKQNGLDLGIDLKTETPIDSILQITDGFGADGVVITAASQSNEVISQAMHLTRKKGRVVLVGDVGLNLKRDDFYKKEIDLLISCSYGPGRYDSQYEDYGIDYPIAYVRWTENRNMETYLNMLKEGKIRLETLETARFSIEEADKAFEQLQGNGPKPLMVYLKYGQNEINTRKVILRKTNSQNSKIKVGIIGAGGFAQGMHLPNLVRLREKYSIHGIMSRTGTNARSVAIQYDAKYATTDAQDIFSDPEIDLVVICTRHNLHAEMTLQALNAGKHVLVEKPLCLSEEELQKIKDFYSSTEPRPILMTGFNRRFAPPIRLVKENLNTRSGPVIINYRMNAGYLPRDHWVHGEEGGGRNVGEACHIYDLFIYLIGKPIVEIQAKSISPNGTKWLASDNFVTTLTFADGSLGTLTYTSMGAKEYPKERMDVFGESRVLTLDNYKSLEILGGRKAEWHSRTIEKGQLEELDHLAKSIQSDSEWPISIDDQIAATEASLQVEKLLKSHVVF